MALIFDERKLNAVKYISKRDGAIDKETSELDEYYEDIINNADKLKLKAGMEPTIFLLNLDLNAREASTVEDSQLKGMDEDKNAVMAMGKWAYTVTKIVLKDIQNPPGETKGIEFKKDGRGYVDDRTLNKLSKMGIVSEIWQQYLSLTSDKTEDKANAKN